MNAPVVLDAHQLARSALEHVIGNVRVGPFDHDVFPLRRAKRADGRGYRVTLGFEARKTVVIRKRGSRQRGIFHVDGVKLAIVGVVRIELKADEPARQQVVDRQFVKYARMALKAIEIQVSGELLGILVENIQRSVDVIDEESLFRTWLLAQKI